MPEAAANRREGRQAQRLLPVLLSALIVLPNNPFVASAFAQVVGASAEGASASGSGAGASVSAGAGSLSVSAPAPLSLTAQAFAAPLSAAAPSAPSAAALVSPAPLVAAAAPMIAASPAPALTVAPAAAARADAAPTPASVPSLKTAAAAASGPSHKAASSAAASAPAKGNETEASDAADGAALFDGKIFIVSHGRAPVETTVASLDRTLQANPELARGLNKNGAVRLVLGNRPTSELAASKEFRAKYPSALGIAEVSPVKQAWGGLVGNPLVKLLLLPFRPRSIPRPTLAGIAALPGRVVGEARFLGRTFRDSMTKPLTSEVIGGLATKSWPLAVSLGVYWTTVGLAHPLAMAGLMALSLFQETFHGIFLNTWNNFQENLSRLRGFSYQMYFNLVYMQGFGAMYRAFSWSANPHKTIPPWSPFYWKDVLVMSLVGTFFGTLGYNGLNQLYAKGRLKRWQRSGIQQLRDVLFLLAGPFFATGSMHAFWALFVFQQALDLTIAVLAWRARTRTILYAVAEGDAAGKTPETIKAMIRERGVSAPASTEKLSLESAKEPAR